MTAGQLWLLGGLFVLLMSVAMLLERLSPRRTRHRRGGPAKPPAAGEIIE